MVAVTGRWGRRRSRGFFALRAIVPVVVLATGCAALPGRPEAQHASRAPRPVITSSSTTTTEPPVAALVWSPCAGDLECATLTVPRDYADPDGPTIGVAVARHPAEDPAARIGSLVIDPGGPGVSGVDDMATQLSVLTPEVLDDFDIVMFDPRGVGRSDPVTCGETPGSPPASTPDPVPVTPEAQGALISGLRQYGAACEKASGTVLPYVGTVDVARDLDRLRQALGDPGLTYMGQSYGSLLGLTYAAMFPTHVRAMVLDGVIDPALSFDQFTRVPGRCLRGPARSVLLVVRRDQRLPVAPDGGSHGQRPGDVALGGDVAGPRGRRPQRGRR